MKSPQYKLAHAARAVLAASILGLVLSPFLYIALGALGAFAPAFSMLALPLLVAGSTFLMVRYVRQQSWQARGKLALLAEALSWLVIASFIAIVSGFTLQTTLERLGMIAAIWSVASVLCLPVVLLRKTAVRDALARLPDALALPLVLALVLAVAVPMGLVLLKPPAFI